MLRLLTSLLGLARVRRWLLLWYKRWMVGLWKVRGAGCFVTYHDCSCSCWRSCAVCERLPFSGQD